MKNFWEKIHKELHTEKITNGIGLVLGLLFVFLSLAYISGAWKEDNFFNNIFSSMLGAAIVAVITLFLLEGQTRSENEKEQNSAIFKKKLEVYQRFLDVLNKIAAKYQLSNSDKINLQFQIAQISVHTEPQRLKTISEQVSSIVSKLYVTNPIKLSINDELLNIAIAIHDELYPQELDADDDNLRKAIQNFGCLRIPERNENAYKLLSWLQNSISLYPLTTHIVGYNDLEVSVKIIDEIKSDTKLNLSAMVMNIVVHVRDDMSGVIYYYTDDETRESLDQILSNERLWKMTRELPNKEVELVKLDISEKAIIGDSIVHNVAVLCRLDKNTTEKRFLNSLYDAIALIYPLWYKEGDYIARRKNDLSNNELQLISFSREKGIVGTVEENLEL